MEIFAGFTEHADVQAGKVIDELDRLGLRDNTIVILHLRRQRLERRGPARHDQRTARAEQHPEHDRAAARGAEGLGGLDALGGPKTDNMYHAGWAWAGDTPFQDTKLVASHFGGTRNPMAISWPARIKPDKTPRAAVPPRQRHRADALRHPRHQAAEGGRRLHAGPDRRRQHGLHLRRRQGAGPQAHAVLRQQWQPRHLSRRLVRLHIRPVRSVGHAGLGRTRSTTGTPNKDVWELYDLRSDFSQADDLARRTRSGSSEMKALFLKEAKENKAFPIGAGNWLRLHPEDRVKTPYTSWHVRRDDDPHAGIHRAGPRPREQPRHDRRRARRERDGRALRARRRLRRAHALHGQGRAGLRIQHDG